MSTLTIRLPDAKHERLKLLAKHQQLSVNKLVEEITTVELTKFDAMNRMMIRASQGDAKRGLALLDKLDAGFAKQ